MKIQILVEADDVLHGRPVVVCASLDALVKASPTDSVPVEGNGVSYAAQKKELANFRYRAVW